LLLLLGEEEEAKEQQDLYKNIFRRRFLSLLLRPAKSQRQQKTLQLRPRDSLSLLYRCVYLYLFHGYIFIYTAISILSYIVPYIYILFCQGKNIKEKAGKL
jgi:hypothetical protein